jgi:hypothetical protein
VDGRNDLDKSEIVEVEAEEVSDDQLTLERIIDGLRPQNNPIMIQPKYNITWEELEELYNYIEQEEDE